MISLVTLLLNIAIPQGGSAAGDLTIPDVVVIPLSPSKSAAVDAGMNALSYSDAGLAAEIDAEVAAGRLDIGELVSDVGATGMTDGTTISIRLTDNPSASLIAIRLQHEFYHYQNGHSGLPYDGGWLTSCEHYTAWVSTLEFACALSCAPGDHVVKCIDIVEFLSNMERYYYKCINSGGSPVWPSTWPTCCCQ